MSNNGRDILKREAIKDLSGSEKKKIKGGGGAPGSVLRGT